MYIVRGVNVLNVLSIIATRNRFNRTGGFFLLLWITHYIPFYAMGRTLYLHHYLPAMACNYLLIGSVFEFMFVEGVNSPISLNKSKHYNLTKSRTTIKSYIAAIVLISLQFMVYLYLSPMTYGTPGLTSEEAYHRKILNSWDVRYGKFYSVVLKRAKLFFLVTVAKFISDM